MKLDVVKELLEASSVLSSMPIPQNDRWVWMSKGVFLELGGTIEAWDQISGDDDAKLLHGVV